MAELKDSGERTEFTTGAVRDIQEGKGRCDLLPLDVVSEVLSLPELGSIEFFKETKNFIYLLVAIQNFATRTKTDIYTLMLEVSKHFEDGAKKYGENNWKKGIDLHCYLNSAVRHLIKHERGDTDEPHDRAFVWNILCAVWTIVHKPELDDVETDIWSEFLVKVLNVPEEYSAENPKPCARCGGPVTEFVVDGEDWCSVMRPEGHKLNNEYICYACWLELYTRFAEMKKWKENGNEVVRHDNLVDS